MCGGHCFLSSAVMVATDKDNTSETGSDAGAEAHATDARSLYVEKREAHAAMDDKAASKEFEDLLQEVATLRAALAKEREAKDAAEAKLEGVLRGDFATHMAIAAEREAAGLPQHAPLPDSTAPVDPAPSPLAAFCHCINLPARMAEASAEREATRLEALRADVKERTVKQVLHVAREFGLKLETKDSPMMQIDGVDSNAVVVLRSQLATATDLSDEQLAAIAMDETTTRTPALPAPPSPFLKLFPRPLCCELLEAA